MSILVCGANGRMGQEIVKSLREMAPAANTIGLTRAGEAVGFQSTMNQLPSKLNSKISVVIDFSSLEALTANVRWAAQNKVPYFCGITGLTTTHKKQLQRAATKIPVLCAANTSLGIAFFSALLNQMTAIKQADFFLSESHHKFKKDSPSGTALFLKEKLEKAIDRKVDQVHGFRGGQIFGEHELTIVLGFEKITIKHEVLSRKVFSDGAVNGALWLSKKKSPGWYMMQDLMSLG